MQNLDYLNLNTIRNYPIKDGLGRASKDGLFIIPNELIADLAVSAPANASWPVHISKIINTAENVVVEISTESEAIGLFNIPINTPNYADIPLSPSTSHPFAVGSLTVGHVSSIQTLARGEFLFDSSQTALLMRVFTPARLGVNYIRFVTEGKTETLTGDVTISAEVNLRFRKAGNTVYLEAGIS